MKVVSGEDAETLERVADVYGADHRGGRAPRAVDQGRRGREGHREHAARPQHRADERARAHLRPHGHPHARTCSRRPARSGTSCSSRPGLVGGHCIGVDPYYLTTKAQQLGYQPEVILAGRRINNNIGAVHRAAAGQDARSTQDIPVKGARVGVLGLTFKENVHRPPQQQGAGHPDRAAPVRHRAADPRPAAATRPRRSTSTA